MLLYFFQNDSCTIERVCYAEGDRNPFDMDTKRVCDPSKSQDEWTLTSGPSLQYH